MKNKSTFKTNLILIIVSIILVFSPLYIARDAEFGGADGQAQDAITEISPGYESWFEPILEPKSGEIESLLFALQAGIGAMVVGYTIGYFKGKKGKEDAEV